jgi:hypothetical protein
MWVEGIEQAHLFAKRLIASKQAKKETRQTLSRFAWF